MLSVIDKDIGKTYLQLLVKFVTGCWQVMCKDVWKVSFVEGPLLESESCFHKLYLPTCHASYSDFKSACVTSLNMELKAMANFRDSCAQELFTLHRFPEQEHIFP